jgi:hypothetical protein
LVLFPRWKQYKSGGNGMPERWKRYAEWVELVCRSGGKGMPNGWKWYPVVVEMASEVVELVYYSGINGNIKEKIRFQPTVYLDFFRMNSKIFLDSRELS